MDTLAPPLYLTADDRPRTPVALLSNQEKDRLIERGFLGLYRWYTARSQETRNWNPDKSFDWRKLRSDFSEPLIRVLQGFFAVEYYTPDYVDEILNLVRRSHGRSHFQLRWGSEEEKHADTWENAVLFSRQRSPEFLERYKHDLRANTHRSLWEGDALRNLIYTVFQERATQLNYSQPGKNRSEASLTKRTTWVTPTRYSPKSPPPSRWTRRRTTTSSWRACGCFCTTTRSGP